MLIHNMFLKVVFSLALLILCIDYDVEAGLPGLLSRTNKPTNFRDESASSSPLVFLTNPFDRSQDPKTLKEIIWPLLGNVLTAVYGTTLVWNTKECTNQLKCMTMFRATGQDKLNYAIQEFRQNFRSAIFTAIKSSPSFYFAQRSMKNLDDRVSSALELVKETREAKADGIITPQEARQLRQLRHREIKNIKRDMRRLGKAGSHIRNVFVSLDFNEIADIVKAFAFQLLAVLSAGSSDSGPSSRRGAFLSNICLFKNLGSLALDANTKLHFPISTAIVSLSSKTPRISLPNNHEIVLLNQEQIADVGKCITYGASAYLVIRRNQLAFKINNALLSASVVMRGLRGIVQALLDRDEDDDDWIWPAVMQFLNGRTGGVLMVTLAATSFIRRQGQEQQVKNEIQEVVVKVQSIDDANLSATPDGKADKEEYYQQTVSSQPSSSDVPKWIQKIHNRIEHAIQKLAIFLEDAL